MSDEMWKIYEGKHLIVKTTGEVSNLRYPERKWME